MSKGTKCTYLPIACALHRVYSCPCPVPTCRSAFVTQPQTKRKVTQRSTIAKRPPSLHTRIVLKRADCRTKNEERKTSRAPTKHEASPKRTERAEWPEPPNQAEHSRSAVPNARAAASPRFLLSSHLKDNNCCQPPLLYFPALSVVCS